MLKKTIIQKLAKYFAEKGKIMTEFEYKQQLDVPVHPVIVKRNIGRWVRVEYFIKHSYPNEYARATGSAKTIEKPTVLKRTVKAQAPVSVIEPAEQDKKDEENE